MELIGSPAGLEVDPPTGESAAVFPGSDVSCQIMPLSLTRPLVYFDLETTGIDPDADKIVEICLQRHDPDGTVSTETHRLQPGRPIPAGATAVHGISDADVADAPRFEAVADQLLAFLGAADLAGFNIQRFDAPLLDREFSDCGRDLKLQHRHMIDAMTIFHRKERRDLSAAARFYLQREHVGAHAAESDVEITADILDAQLNQYDDLPQTVEELAQWTRGDRLDLMGKFAWSEGQVVFTFGKHRGHALATVADKNQDYCRWFLDANFREDAKSLVRDAIDGHLPSPPSA